MPGQRAPLRPDRSTGDRSAGGHSPGRPHFPLGGRRLAPAAAILLVAAMTLACAKSSNPHAAPPAPASTGPTNSGAVAPVDALPPRCGVRARTTPVVASAVPGLPNDWTLTSFDSAKIRLHWYPVHLGVGAATAPSVLMGPGWGMAGDTNVAAPSGAARAFGGLAIASLHDAGYNVLTWDPRGFGNSTGTIEVDSEAYEGRDVVEILDWLATQPGVQLDGPGDPRVGMVGGSYGGGIQFVVAALDCRIDAIVPAIAWNSLTSSLDKAGTVKTGWASLLIAATPGRQLDPHIMHAYNAGTATGRLSADDFAWYAQRGVGDLVEKVKAPTLIIQGTVDGLFTLSEGVTNYRILRGDHVPTAMIWYCGGHGVCLTNPGDQSAVTSTALAWLAHYLKGDTTVATGPRFQFVDQNGSTYTAPDYPLPIAAPIVADGQGTLALTASGGSGPAIPPANSQQILAGLAGRITPAKASNAVDVGIDAGGRAAVVVGAPQLTITYRGSVPPGDRPTRVFAQLVDDSTGLVLGNQVTPIAVTLDGQQHTVTVALEIVAYTARGGAHLTLQLVATTVAYGTPRLGGTVAFDHVRISLPVAAGLSPR